MTDRIKSGRATPMVDRTVSARLALLNLTSADRERLRATWPSVEPHAGAFVDRLYKRFQQTSALAAILGHESRIKRLAELQLQYLEQLFCAPIDADYVSLRAAIGQVHHRIRVTPQWYIATYAHFLAEHVDVCLSSASDSLDGLHRLDALVKSVFFDISIALDAYGQIERHVQLAMPMGSDSGDERMERAALPENGPVARDEAGSMRRIRLDAADVELRKAYVGLGDEDERRLEAIGVSVEQAMPSIVDDFYRLIQSQPELQSLVPNHAVDRLKQQVKAYWRELVTTRFDNAYAASRMRLGVVHEQVGLELHWYLTGFARQVSGVMRAFAPDDPELRGKLKTLLRTVCFDATFVVDAYMEARAASLLEVRGMAQRLLHGLSSAVVVVDHDRRIQFANAPFVALSGVEPALLYQMPLPDALPLAEWDAAFAQLDSEPSCQPRRHTVRHGERTFRLTVTQLDDPGEASGPIAPIAVVLDDVSEVFRLSETVASDDAQYRNLTRHVSAVLWEMDYRSRTILTISQPTIDLLGYRDVTFLGTPDAWLQAILDEDREQFEAACKSLETSPRTMCDYRMVAAEGRVVRVRSYLRRIDGATPTTHRIAAVTVDVTQPKEAERLRLAAIEHVAAGVSYAVNNALTVVMANIERHRSGLEARHAAATPPAPLLDDALEGARRASRVVSHLLAFTGQQFLQPRIVNLNDLLKAALPKIQLWVGDSVKVRTDFDQTLPRSRVDADQFLVMVSQLCDNARRAMPAGGAITIRTTQITSSGLVATLHPAMRPQVEVIIDDNGIGMTDEVRWRAVEPFFTTATFPKRDGLGLSMAHGFMLQSGGQLLLESQLGHGTRVRLCFPSLPTDPSEGAERPASVAQPTVLIVDSDLDVLRAAEQIVRDCGYGTRTATDAERALALAAQSPIGLVLTEIRLPGKADGIELAKQLDNTSPKPAIILMHAGHVPGTMTAEMHPHWAILQKPFTAAELTDRLRRELQRPTAGDQQPTRLSPREREVLRQIAMGKTQVEVGDLLGISERTVEQHIRAVRRKLNASNTIQAVVEAIHRQEI